MTVRKFELYPEERHWWSFNDYGAVIDAMARLKAQGESVARVLEFGPGSSTLALIEGGATAIDTCEDDPDWAKTYEERLVKRFPKIVRLHRYTWVEPLSIPAIDGQTYDLALIDGPLGSDRRGDVVRYALDRCASVLAPTEDRNRKVREELQAIATERGLYIDIRDTGPLSGGFALITRDRTRASLQKSARSVGLGVGLEYSEMVHDPSAVHAPQPSPRRPRRTGKATETPKEDQA